MAVTKKIEIDGKEVFWASASALVIATCLSASALAMAASFSIFCLSAFCCAMDFCWIRALPFCEMVIRIRKSHLFHQSFYFFVGHCFLLFQCLFGQGLELPTVSGGNALVSIDPAE